MVDKIGYTKPTAARIAALKRASGADSVAFSEALSKAESSLGADATSAAHAADATAAMTGSTGLLGLQEVSEEETNRRRSIKKGRLTLEALMQLRDALLIGTLPMRVLQNLEKIIASERAFTTDPRLEAILNEIDVRAAVEIAKLEMSGYGSADALQRNI